MVPIDVNATHIYPWSAAEATAAPIPVPVVGGGLCGFRLRAAIVPPTGESLCAPAPLPCFMPIPVAFAASHTHARTPLWCLAV